MPSVVPGRRVASNPKSRDSPMCNCTSEVWSFEPSRNDQGKMRAMPIWGNKTSEKQSALSADFGHALTREILSTELLRVKATLATITLLVATLIVVYAISPDMVERIWHGHSPVLQLAVTFVPFVLFELSVLRLVSARLAQGRDVPYARRYLGALIETSLPTVGLYLEMKAMGPAQALAFAVPLAYFIFIILTCGILAGAVGVQLRRQFAASIQAATARDRVTDLFGQHVSPQVVERLMVEGASTASDIRRVAVMFVDFRSFTAGARSRSPQAVVDRLDGAFAVLVEILDRHGGIVNKFLGDGFLALFGAPFEAADAAQRAVSAAREMLIAMDSVNKGGNWPLRIGIGIHFGEVVAGNIGSPRRKEYTVIGDTVNFAARLESLNKEFNSQLLISAVVRDALGEECRDAVSLGEVPVRGYDRPMTVWQLG